VKVPWNRVSREKRCPICGRPDWCVVTKDGTAAICARTESAKRCGEAGWLHRLVESPWRPARAMVRSVTLSNSTREKALHFARLAAEYQAEVKAHDLDHLARGLGLSVNSLQALGIGWAASFRAWSFPMVDADGNTLGVRLRRPDGFKFSLKGGKEGVFLPAVNPDGDKRLLVCEGPTDATALLDLGFPNVIGRPSCTGGIKIIVDLVRRRTTSAVIIVADGDEPGQLGADNLASVLLAYVPAVQVIAPPVGIKDARAWLQAGGTRADVEQAIQAAKVRRLSIISRRVR
jgi:phage/plasmid primase-like uncharacterized protein